MASAAGDHKVARIHAARRSRNQIVLVLLLVLVLDPISDYENEDDDEDEKFAQLATIWTDTVRILGFSDPWNPRNPWSK